MGNKLTTDINGFTMALMSNRSVFVTSNFPEGARLKHDHAYSFVPSVLTSRSLLPSSLQQPSRHFVAVPTDSRWSCFDVAGLVNGPDQFVGIDNLLYGPMVYVNADTAQFCWAHFGGHAAYFVGHYFSRFPAGAVATAAKVLEAVPPNRTVLGIHIRFHRAGQYYSHDLNQTMQIVYEEVDRRVSANRGLVLAVATDTEDIKQRVITRYGERVLMADVLRKPDKDHQGAQVDMALLLGSDELMATYRSTFSWVVVSRFGRAAWWIEKEAPHWFPASNSQAVGVSIVYHWRDHCDWRTNDRVRYCGRRHRQWLQRYFDYLVL
jgi:hypothetical protein